MTIDLRRPRVDEMGDALDAMRAWQDDQVPLKLHPGDIGWFYRWGTEAAADAVRTWSRNGRILAVSLLDGPDLLRMTFAPEAWRDEELSRKMVDDIIDPERGVLPAGKASLEIPSGTLIRDLLPEHGWDLGERWTPLRRDLSAPVPDPGVRVEVAGPDDAETWAEVLRASFDGSTFSAERWHNMAAGPRFADARPLLAYDDSGNAVAVATVWSAGPGRPGVIEPLGAHRDHRGRGYGKAMTIAAAAALRRLGASTALVIPATANSRAVAAYESAGFTAFPEGRDLERDA